MSIIDELDQARADRWRPPPAPLTMSEFAVTMKLPDGPHAGEPWDPRTEPAQHLFIALMESKRWRQFVVVAPSQRGKTLVAILMVWLWAVTQLRRAVGYVMPNIDKLSQNWVGKLQPSMENAGFKDWLPIQGPGSKGGRPAVLKLRNPITKLLAGLTYFMALGTGGRETSTSSVSPAVILVDEADDAKNSGQLKLTFKRIESWGTNGLAIIASTVNDRVERDEHPVLVLHSEGTRTRLHHKCPHCHFRFAPDFEHFNFDSAQIACPSCGALWDESQRHQALRDALVVHHGQSVADDIVIGPEPTCDTCSMLTVGTDYHMAVFPTIAAEYRAAKVQEARGFPSQMQNHMQKVWCREYVEPEQDGVLDSRTLVKMAAASTVFKGTIPTWGQYCVLTVDVQQDLHYWLLQVFGPEERWAIIDFGYEYLVPKDANGNKSEREPTSADRIRVMNKIRDMANAGWRIAGEDAESPRRMRPVQRGIDCGYQTKEVVAWVSGNPEWKAVRGVGEDDVKFVASDAVEKPLAPDIIATGALRAQRPQGWPVYAWKVDGHVFRKNVHAALLRKGDQMGAGMLPRGEGSHGGGLISHLTGELWTEPEPSKDGRQGKPYWRQVANKRHDWLDCAVYGQALALVHRYMPDLYDAEGKLTPRKSPRKYGNLGSVR